MITALIWICLVLCGWVALVAVVRRDLPWHWFRDDGRIEDEAARRQQLDAIVAPTLEPIRRAAILERTSLLTFQKRRPR